MILRNFLLKNKLIRYYLEGKRLINDPHYLDIQLKTDLERSKKPSRTQVINFLLSLNANETSYLEIGVRNPQDNFNHIKATRKYSVDPGVEFESNPVDFKMTSDHFFQKLHDNEVLSNDIKFDVIFIDGLHLAEQVNRDIEHALQYVKEDGFVVLHDCNPPSEWHARERYNYWNTPARYNWNGTTWKAFLKWRQNPSINSCCIDCDWGVGILSKKQHIGRSADSTNPFFEFNVFDKNRKELLNLIDFDDLKRMLSE